MMKINKIQLKMGTIIEMEHTKSRKRARKIAMDHLVEFLGFKYYTELKKLENKAKKYKK
jgi:hypothetical protein